MDALYIAMITGVIPITPSSHHNLLLQPFPTQRTMVTLKTNEDNNDDSHDSLTQAHMDLQMCLGDDFEPDIRSLCPARSSNQHDGFKTS